MPILLLKILGILLLLGVFGFFVVRLAGGILGGWRLGRVTIPAKGSAGGRTVRASARPGEFWFTMFFWHVMFILNGLLFLGLLRALWLNLFGA